MIDAYGRKIRYLRISVTDLCNYRCKYCMREEGVDKHAHSDILSFEEIEEITAAAARLGIDKIRLTGGEPLVLTELSLYGPGLHSPQRFQLVQTAWSALNQRLKHVLWSLLPVR